MISPSEIVDEIKIIQTILDQVEVRRAPNVQALAVVYERLDQLKINISNVINEIQNGTDKESEIDGENDTNSA